MTFPIIDSTLHEPESKHTNITSNDFKINSTLLDTAGEIQDQYDGQLNGKIRSSASSHPPNTRPSHGQRAIELLTNKDRIEEVIGLRTLDSAAAVNKEHHSTEAVADV